MHMEEEDILDKVKKWANISFMSGLHSSPVRGRMALSPPLPLAMLHLALNTNTWSIIQPLAHPSFPSYSYGALEDTAVHRRLSYPCHLCLVQAG